MGRILPVTQDLYRTYFISSRPPVYEKVQGVRSLASPSGWPPRSYSELNIHTSVRALSPLNSQVAWAARMLKTGFPTSACADSLVRVPD